MSDYDVYAVFEHLPELTGMELVKRYGKWIGPYYLSGERHPFRKDKIAFTLYNGCITCHEEGGESMGIVRWLQTYGGASDRKEALSWLRNARKMPIRWSERESERKTSQYVANEVYEAARGYGRDMCPLFRWMCSLFGREMSDLAWDRYRVTTDSDGLAVFWYTDPHGRIVHDKRVRYRDDGHRDKTFGGSRLYRTSDGYDGRCYFGEHLVGEWDVRTKPVYVVESEKTAMLVWLWSGRDCVATGGKSTLREAREGERWILLPDMDAVDDWSRKGEVYRWWDRWDGVPQTADIGDYIVKLKKI